LTDTNYRELTALYERHQAAGFMVLAFPCNQFGGQEPGTAEEIATFAKGYGAAFPMFGKIDVNGMNTHPLYMYLKQQKGELLGSDIKWNFAKFLVGADGEVIDRYGPQRSPTTIEEDILEALKAVPPTQAVVTPTGAALAK